MIWKAEAIFFLGIKLLLFKFMFCRGGIGAGFKDKDWCLWEKWLREVAQEVQKKKKNFSRDRIHTGDCRVIPPVRS